MIDAFLNQLSDQALIYRHERKFFSTTLSKQELESIVKLHPALFTEIYYERSVNNIYFDSIAKHSYFDNIEGAKTRLKARIRWYGPLFGLVNNPILELKIKKGLLGTKMHFPLKAFVVDSSLQYSTVAHVFEESLLPLALKSALLSLKFSLLNCYQRKYFQSANGKYRVTIDSNLVFYKMEQHHNTFIRQFTDFTNTILELKYNAEDDEEAHTISSYFPMRLTRSSKYINGATQFWW